MHVCSGLQPSLREHTKPRVHGYQGTDTKDRSISSRMRVWMPSRPHAYMQAYTHARIHACTHARMHACTYARMQAYMSASLCWCRYAFMGVFVPALLRSCAPALLRCCDAASSFCLFAHTFVHPTGYAFSLPVCMHAFMCACIFMCAGMWPRALERVSRTRVSALMPIYGRYKCMSACEGMWYVVRVCERHVRACGMSVYASHP
jgi:hypothetical protein